MPRSEKRCFRSATTKVPQQNMKAITLDSLIDTSKPSLWIALAAIAFNPTAWNIVAQNGKVTPKLFHDHVLNAGSRFVQSFITRPSQDYYVETPTWDATSWLLPSSPLVSFVIRCITAHSGTNHALRSYQLRMTSLSQLRCSLLDKHLC